MTRKDKTAVAEDCKAPGTGKKRFPNVRQARQSELLHQLEHSCPGERCSIRPPAPLRLRKRPDTAFGVTQAKTPIGLSSSLSALTRAATRRAGLSSATRQI